MMNNNVIILEQYRDKSYVMNILCQLSSEKYDRIKNLISIPLITINSGLTILNAVNIDKNIIKYVNISFNSTTAVVLALSNNFKISEKSVLFRDTALKFNKLTHKIEDMLSYNIDDITHEDVKNIIYEYDVLNEGLIYAFPNVIKEKVKNTYKNKKVLPNILNCERNFSSHIELKSSIVNNEPKVLTIKPFVEVVEC